MMSNPPAREHGGKLVGRAAVFPWAATGREVDVATPVLVEKPGIVLVGHIVDRIIEVEVVVVHSVHGIAQIVNAGERVAALHVVGMLEEGVSRVIGAERCAVGGDRDARRLAHGVDEWEDFAGHVVIVLRLQPAAVKRMRAFVAERIALHAVDAEDSDSPRVQIRSESANHALTFLLMLVAATGGESKDGHAVMPVNIDAHVAAETVRVPTLMVAVHGWRAYRVGGRAQAPCGAVTLYVNHV